MSDERRQAVSVASILERDDGGDLAGYLGEHRPVVVARRAVDLALVALVGEGDAKLIADHERDRSTGLPMIGQRDESTRAASVVRAVQARLGVVVDDFAGDCPRCGGPGPKSPGCALDSPDWRLCPFSRA